MSHLRTLLLRSPYDCYTGTTTIGGSSSSSSSSSIATCTSISSSLSAAPSPTPPSSCSIRAGSHSRALQFACHLKRPQHHQCWRSSFERRQVRVRSWNLTDMDVQELEETDFVWENPDTPATTSDYIFLNGKRLVRPYFFEFIAHVKDRWAGKTIVDLFAHEFRKRPREYYEKAVNCGRLRVDGQKVDKDFVVRSSQCLSHFVHRHEPPVAAGAVTILDETDDVITVCKPPSVPVHPCGQYRKNTVVGILQAEHKCGHLFPIHRLDRLVSGLLILAKNASTADCFRQEIESCSIQKEYVAKVQGVFPPNEVSVDAAIIYNARDGKSTVQIPLYDKESSRVHSKPNDQNRENQSPDSAGNDIKGKRAITRFQRLSTDGAFSIVRCMPLTGRTHQIRVHLQYLGYPIANDLLYLDRQSVKYSSQGTAGDVVAKQVYAPSLLELSSPCHNGLATDSEQPLDLSRGELCSGDLSNRNVQPNLVRFSPDGAQVLSNAYSGLGTLDHRVENTSPTGNARTGLMGAHLLTEETMQQDGSSSKRLKLTSKDPDQKVNHSIGERGPAGFTLDPMCTNCPNLEPSGYEDPLEGLLLHCVRYSSSKWSYECPLPDWAL